MKSRAESLQNQSEQIVTFTLVELLTALVFIAMTLALVLKDEALRNLDPSREHVKQLTDNLLDAQNRIVELERETRTLQAELEAQRSLVRRLMRQAGAILPPNDVVIVPKEQYDAVRSAIQVSEDQQKELAELLRLNAMLKGGGDVVRPSCITNSGYLLRITLNGDGSITSAPNWPAVANNAVSKIDGIGQLASSGAMNANSFAAAAQRVDGWARRQTVPCAFRVVVASRHSNLSLYLRQLSIVERSFYVARAR